MELPHRAVARLAAVGLALLVSAGLPAAASAAELERPASQTEPPPFFERSANEVERIAARAEKVRDARRDGPLDPTAYTKGVGRWQVSFFRDRDEQVQVQVDDRSGAVLEQWSGDQVAWTMARGYPGAFGRKLNAPYVWIPLCLLFLAPFVDVRRPFRLLHLDLLVLLSFGVSHYFFNRGEIGVSAPLVYPVLLYLLGRMLFAAFRPRRAAGPLVPHAPLTLLVVGLVFLCAFRIGLNIADSNVIDVGYAGVIGADRIADGDPLFGDGFSDDVERGDTYGPVTYLLYVPFEQALPWSGLWDDLPAAHAAAIAFDLLAIGGLLLLGRRLRLGRDGVALGVALAYAWTAYPYTAFVLESNSNDTLVALACIAALLGASVGRPRASAAATALAVGLGATAKFVTVALAPLFAAALAARVRGHVRPRAGVDGRALRPRRRRSRALRPDDRVPGEPPVAVQPVGPGRVARLAPDRREGRGRGARARRGIRPAAPGPAPARGARSGGPDRHRADRDTLVLPLRGLVRAVRVRGAVRRARPDASRGGAGAGA